jgi:hypothetical protein
LKKGNCRNSFWAGFRPKALRARLGPAANTVWLAHNTGARRESALARSPRPHPVRWRGCHRRVSGQTGIHSSRQAPRRHSAACRERRGGWGLTEGMGGGEVAIGGFGRHIPSQWRLSGSDVHLRRDPVAQEEVGEVSYAP